MVNAVDPDTSTTPSFNITAGRRIEIGKLAEVLGRLSDSAPQVVEIHGETGIGKTRLLDELARMAADHGMELVSGRAGEYERDVPFGMVTQALDRLAGREVDDETRLVLDALSPDLAAGLAGGAERYRLYRAVHRMATRFAKPPGLVVLLDDLHWADTASLELVEHLLQDMPRVPLLVAVAYRGHHVPPGLPGALARTRADVTRLAPGPFDADDVAELLPDATARRRRLLLAASGGNPLYLDALARVDDRTVAALADPDHADPDEMPRRLQALLMTELRSLDASRRLVAQAAAIAGDPADLDLVTSIADAPEDEVFKALDDLVALGVVHTAGSRFRFRHPLVRAAAYQSAGPAWRIGGHRRAEEYLRARGGPLPLRAHHLSRAARHGDDDVITTLAEAATAALDNAPAHAVEWARTALRLLPERAERRVEVLLLLARALGLTGRLEESREILHEVLEMSGPPRGVAVRFCAVVDRLLGRLDEARALLEAESGADQDERGRMLVELAATDLLRGDLVGCAANARRAVDAGPEDRGRLAAGTTLLGLAALHGAEVAAAREHLVDAVRLVDGLSDSELRDHLHVLPPLAWLELHLERYADSARHLGRGLAIARANGQTHVLPYLLIVDSAVQARTGRLTQARRRAEDARETSALIGSPETTAMANAIELRSALWQRGPEAALPLGSTRAKSRWWAEESDLFVTSVHLFADRPAQAVEHIAPHVGDDPKDVVGLHAVRWVGSLAIAKAHLGSLDEALDLSEHALLLAAAMDLPFQHGIAHLTRSRVLAECGQLPLSVDEASVAVRWFTEARAPLYRAMAHDFAAVALSAAGDLQRARVEFGKAKNGYAACEAGWLLTRVRNSESRLGARAPRPRRPDAVGTVDALSVREREIARLVADGLTNREIAARLFLSAKTVEAHLARMFTKLGVKSRVGVAQRLSGAESG
ncbi:ATP-binding protein [Umezawaea sp. NPDC059074]|uniref:ATP-binding protein n=1 Tax=Umezawaea sp. NPDC059074 TaxID=3346716 RepID=UPI0036B6ECF2